MPNAAISQITVPVNVSGTITNTTFDIKDAGARQMIQDLGDALYWIGVTTTELVDDTTTSAIITVSGESVTAKTGGMAQYSGEEFVYNGTKWQSIGKNNFGALAFKSSATGNITPAGTISGTAVSADSSTTTNVNSITAVGTLPSFTVSGETLTFDAGTLPTKGENTSVLTAVGTLSVTDPTFTGTEGSVTVS